MHRFFLKEFEGKMNSKNEKMMKFRKKNNEMNNKLHKNLHKIFFYENYENYEKKNFSFCKTNLKVKHSKIRYAQQFLS